MVPLSGFKTKVMVVFLKIGMSFIFIFSGAICIRKKSSVAHRETSLKNHLHLALLLDLDFYF